MTAPVRPTTILTRASLAAGSEMSSLQTQVDGLVRHFVEEAASPTTLAAITAGGLAYRLGRIGIMGMGSSAVLRPLSVIGGLGSEVTAFEFANRSLITFRATSQSPLQDQSPTLWSWSGPGGWRDGLTTSLITFGMLRGAGFLAREQNLAFQHLLQSTAMVGGHQVAGRLGIAPRPEGTLAEQFLQAEATNLQMSAGARLIHSLAPGMVAFERGLDLSLVHQGEGRGSLRPNPWVSLVPEPLLAEGEIRSHELPGSEEKKILRPTVVAMSSLTGSGAGSSKPSPIFQDPARTLHDGLPLLTEYQKGETYLIAQEGQNQLRAEFKEGPMHIWGPSVKMEYFLNGEKVGWRTFQLNPETRIFRAGKVEIDPAFRHRGLGKIVLLHDLYQTHRLGWVFQQMITNPFMVHTAVKTRYQGRSLFSPDTLIQRQVQNLDPWEPEMVNQGDPLPLYQFDPEGLKISNYEAYQIMGRPNPSFFEAIAEARELEKSLPRISKTARSSEGVEYPFDLLLPDLEQVLQAPEGAEFPIAKRGEFPLLLQISEKGRTRVGDSFFPSGIPELKFVLKEGETRGLVRVMVEPETLSLFELDLTPTKHKLGPKMAPGAGSIVLEWFATQAGLQGKKLNLAQIGNFQVMGILMRQGLFDEANTEVQACSWKDKEAQFYWIMDSFPLSDTEAQRRNLGSDFFNVRGNVNPSLTKIAPRISRTLQSSQGVSYPFELLLPDIQEIQKAPVGARFPIATREGRTIFLQVRTQDQASYMDTFVGDGTPRTIFDLIEGEGRGQLELYWTPNSISGYDINTLNSLHYNAAPSLPPGAGVIVGEWLATQAALNGWGLNLFLVKNSQVVDGLVRRNLMDLDSARVEIRSWVDPWLMLSATEEATDFKNPERLIRILEQNPPGELEVKFLTIKGRPHPDLVPPHLRPPRR